jgi:NADPH:quinone reductase-like Zn-dependent oxidoreductase
MPQVLLCDLIDGAPQLVLRELPAVEPAPGEVRYQVHAVGLNRADLLYMQGGHCTQIHFPTRIGYEACGIVDAIGAGVTEFKVGDRVSALPFGEPKYSVAGEFAVTPAEFLAAWPEGYSEVEAAGTWMPYLTAYFALAEVARVGPGDAVLITAASSSAAIGAIQLARYFGASVIASTRTNSKRDFLIATGAHHVVATSDGDVAGQILQLTGGAGARVIYDAVAGPFMHQYAEAVATKAQIFVYGAMGGKPTVEAPILPLIRKGATIELYSLINYIREAGAARRARDFIARALQAGAMRPVIDRVFPLAEAAQAYAYMDTGAQRGKIVLRTALAGPP